MKRSRTLTALIALAAVAAPTAVASAASTSPLWQNQAKTVTCGIKIHLPRKPANTLLCAAKGIPKAKTGVGDPFVQLTRAGRPQLVLISQQSWVAALAGKKPTTLKPGSTWSSLGITCTFAAKTVTCTNTSRHGFTLGNGKYKSF